MRNMTRYLKFSAYQETFHYYTSHSLSLKNPHVEGFLLRNVSSSAERVRVRSDCFSNFQDEVRRRIVTYHSAVVQTKAEIFFGSAVLRRNALWVGLGADVPECLLVVFVADFLSSVIMGLRNRGGSAVSFSCSLFFL